MSDKNTKSLVNVYHKKNIPTLYFKVLYCLVKKENKPFI